MAEPGFAFATQRWQSQVLQIGDSGLIVLQELINFQFGMTNLH